MASIASESVTMRVFSASGISATSCAERVAGVPSPVTFGAAICPTMTACRPVSAAKGSSSQACSSSSVL